MQTLDSEYQKESVKRKNLKVSTINSKQNIKKKESHLKVKT